ncbi:MAG: helix-turn-helix domain-containing protein [Acidiferrobacteraceae bacterium]
MKNRVYNDQYQTRPWSIAMPHYKTAPTPSFGQRLAALRKTVGYTQVELAREIGVSQRMISHYEGRAEHPPAGLLPDLAQALGVTTDMLLGIKPSTKARRDTRLERRLQQVQRLDPKPRQQILQLIDTFIEAEQLKRQTG